MPEAPDLYVVREYLERRLTGQTVTKAEALRPIVLRCLAAPLERFAEDIAGRSLDGFWRRGKFLGIELSGGHDGGSRTLVVNPMLSGALQHCAPTERVSARTYLSLTLSDGSQLRYTDDDQMGMVYYLLPEQLSQAARLGEQGPDVLDEPLSLQAFADRLKPYRGEIKGVLTRGGAVSGIGNAYADEVLFAAGIYPFKKRTSLSPDRARRAPRRRLPRPRRSRPPPPRAHGRQHPPQGPRPPQSTRPRQRGVPLVRLQAHPHHQQRPPHRLLPKPASRGACWGGGRE